jgi:1-acyl-sn-glycerol-3-phosphate acyltransferase
MPAERSPLRLRYSRAASRGFDLFFQPWRSRRITRTPMVNLPSDVPTDRPLLIVANHTSWWDGFLLRDVHTALRPRAPLYAVMTATELRRHPFLRLLGGVPLQPGSPASLLRLVRALRDAARTRPACTVIFFPQGRIWPAWRRPLGFQRGVELFARALAPCCVLPAALHIEPLNHAAPAAFLRLGSLLHVPGQDVTAVALEAAVTAELDELAAVLCTYGESAAQHHAGPVTRGVPWST